ncbi:MAG: histidine kinase [Leptolyngbya sp. IPPAS B-1204]|nr:histidine kinase [Elainella sp. C42_A2020_010]RNJ67862.1 MAG: histidine kinase [Leptolyngbya sp. IPPAS B-1204]
MTSPLEEKQTHQQIEQIKTDLRRAQQEGQLRTERIREIVRDAMAQVAGEVKQGSGEIQVLAKEALTVVIETLQGRGKEIRDDLAASIEGIIDGISHARRDAINQSQTEVNQLQAHIQQQEEQLNAEIEGTLTELETDAKSSSADVRAAIESAVAAIQESEEATLLRKRYAQLQAQLAILRANLAARYGDRYEEMKRHLDDAKAWYQEAQTKAATSEPGAMEQKQAEFEQKIGEAGAAIARKEKQVKQILKDLLHTVVELVKDDKGSR